MTEYLWLKEDRKSTLVIKVGNKTVNFEDLGSNHNLGITQKLWNDMKNQQEEVYTKHDNHLVCGEGKEEIDAEYEKEDGE